MNVLRGGGGVLWFSRVLCSFSWVILVALSNINGVDNCIPRTNVLNGGGGGYYDPQIILREHDNLTILDGPSLIIEGLHSPPPPI